MMLDVVKARAQLFFRDAKHARKLILHVAYFRGVPESILDLMTRQLRNPCGGKQDLLVQVCGWIARDSNVVQIFNTDAGGLETVSNRLRRKARRVLEPVEALLFDRSDQLPIADNRRRRIAVIRINTENIHLRLSA